MRETNSTVEKDTKYHELSLGIVCTLYTLKIDNTHRGGKDVS